MDLIKKRSNEDQCPCQEHIMHIDAREKRRPRRRDRCSCRTRCTQTASHVWQLERRPGITYNRGITHKNTEAPFHVRYHAAGRDDQRWCHNPMRCSRRMPTTSQRLAWVQHMAPMTNRRQSDGRGRVEGERPAMGSLGVAPRATVTKEQDRVGGGTSVAHGSAWLGRVDCSCPGWANTAEMVVRAVRALVTSWVAATHSLRSHSHQVSLVAGTRPCPTN